MSAQLKLVADVKGTAGLPSGALPTGTPLRRPPSDAARALMELAKSPEHSILGKNAALAELDRVATAIAPLLAGYVRTLGAAPTLDWLARPVHRSAGAAADVVRQFQQSLATTATEITSRFEQALSSHEVRLKELEQQIDMLLGAGASEFSADPAGEWMARHQAEVAKHKGEHVAVHPERGIVASGVDLQTVHDEVKRQGLLPEVTFDLIPKL